MNMIRLLFKSLKGAVFSSLTLIVVLGAALLTLNYVISQYMYIRLAGDMLERAGIGGGLHFINTSPYDEENQAQLDKLIEELSESGEAEKTVVPLSADVYIGGIPYRLELYDADIYPAMYGAPYEGSWPEEGETDCGVLCGVRPGDAPVGGIVTATSVNPGSDAELKVRITGALGYPPMCFRTGFYSSSPENMTADKFFADDRTLYMPYSDGTARFIAESFNGGNAPPVSSGLIFLSGDVSAGRFEEIRQALEKHAKVTPTDDILSGTRAQVSSNLRRLLPLPLFLLSVTSLAYISVAVLGLYRRRADFTVYSMQGCSGRRMLLLACAPAALTLLLTDAAVIAASLVLKDKAAVGSFTLPGLVFGAQNIILTLAASAALFAAVVIIAARSVGRFSPAEQLRQARE